MSGEKDGGPAFGHGSENGHCCGATLRDLFAAAALTGILGDLDAHFGTDGRRTPESIANWVGEIADALLTERAKGLSEEEK